MTKRKQSRRQKHPIRRVLARLATYGSTMLGHALFTVQNLWSRQEPGNPDSYGCRNCGVIYAPRVFYLGSGLSGSVSEYCPRCCSNRVEYLGPLPSTVENKDGVYLIGSVKDPPLGPFKTRTDARDHLWAWFDRKKHGTEERPNAEGKIITLHPKGDTVH